MNQESNPSGMKGLFFVDLIITAVLSFLALGIFGWTWWILSIMGGIWLALFVKIILSGERFPCPKCGESNKTDASKCKKCGFQFLEQCPRCYSQINKRHKYCANCGDLMTEMTPIPESLAQEHEASEPVKNFCPACGKHLNDSGVEVCPSCGMLFS